MNLYPLSKVIPDETGMVCRQSRLWGVVGVLLVGGLLIAAPVFWYRVEAPWIVWGLTGGLALFIVPMLVADTLDRFRAASWVLWAKPDGLWINVRSYQNHHLDDAPVVVFLDYTEIASAGRHVQSFSTPTNRSAGSRSWSVQSLELRLKHGDTAPVVDAVRTERAARPAVRRYFGVVRVSSRASHFAVTMPAANLMRIAWRGGHGNHVSPSLDRILREIGCYVELVETSRQSRGDWDALTEAEVDDQILELVQSGATIGAIRLLKRRKGYTTTEARRFVEELVQRI